MPEAVTPTSTPSSTEPRKRRRQHGSSKLVQQQSALLRLSSTIVEAQDEREICERVVNGLHDPALGYAERECAQGNARDDRVMANIAAPSRKS